MNDEDVPRGAGIYSRPVLKIYDLLVVRFSNSLAWRCPSEFMLAQYDRCLGRRHLDVGPGTGWYLDHVKLPDTAEITLMDLNENSLRSASGRLDGPIHQQLIADVLKPLPDKSGSFDSIGVNYLLHCVPGTWAEKGVAFRHLADHLAGDGTLFGATILGSGVDHNRFGRFLMAFYNRIGVFHNYADDAAGLQRELERNFDEVHVDVVGTVAMFSARSPRQRR